jgi:hypothetical protein
MDKGQKPNNPEFLIIIIPIIIQLNSIYLRANLAAQRAIIRIIIIVL